MRFVPITKDVSIQYWMEFIGEAADKVRGIEAELHPYVADIYYEPERIVGDKTLKATTRLYLDGYLGTLFSGDVIFHRVDPDKLKGVQEDFCKIQLRRENNARIVCFRPGDENPALTGFGRTKPGATRSCHQDFSETYVDRKPGTEFTNYKGEKQVWNGFNRLYLKVQPADFSESYYLEIAVDWDNTEDGHVINIFVGRDNGVILKELVVYEFSRRGSSVVADPEQEKKNAGALEDLFLRTRKPTITDGRPGSGKVDKGPHPHR